MKTDVPVPPIAAPRPAGLTLAAVAALRRSSLLAAVPWLGVSEFQRSLLIEVMIFSILAMSLNLILGYAGLVSFGHAAFFAVGSYAAGLSANSPQPGDLALAAGRHRRRRSCSRSRSAGSRSASPASIS